MGRYGPVLFKFYAPDNLSTALSVSGVSTKTPVDMTYNEVGSGEGTARVTFVNDTALSTLAAVGNVCYATQTNTNRSDLGSAGVVVCEPFIIRSRRTVPGTDLITLEGQDLLSEMKKFTIYRPLGLETITNTTLTAAVRAPFATTLAIGAPRNNKSMAPTTSDEDDPGREVRNLLNNGNTQVNLILGRVFFDGYWRYELRDRFQDSASTGNYMQVRDRRISVANAAPFAEGTEVHLTTTSGTFITLVEEAPDGDIVTLRDGVPYSAVNGAAVTNKDYSGKSTNDVTTVMGYATGWSVDFETGTGTAAGTRYGGGGDTVYDVLRTIAAETGEYFRLQSAEASPAGPKRTVKWRRTYFPAGVGGLVRLVEPSQANMATEVANKNRAIMLQRPEHEGQYDPVTQVIPVPSDPRISLFNCSSSALATATADGFSVITTGLGLYAPPYVQNNALQTSIGTAQRRVSFSDVTVEGDNALSLVEAADKMLRLAINFLKEHVTTAKVIRVSCISDIGIRAGDYLELYYQSPTGEYTLDYTGASVLNVLEVTRTVSQSADLPGTPITELVLSPTTRSHTRGGEEIGRRLKTIERAMVQIGTPRPTLSAVTVGTGGGSTPPPPITGSGVYLPLAGGTMTGNIGLGSGLTVDGVDISAHAADPAAHHALVTAGDTSINVSGQAVNVALAAHSGLTTSSGLGVTLTVHSGLAVTGHYLLMGTPTTLTATTSNALIYATHTHAITSTNTGFTTFSTLLATDSAGKISLNKLTVGVAHSDSALSSTTMLLKTTSASTKGLHVRATASQTAYLTTWTSSADLTYLKVTADGNMESGNPGFVSGLTGWQINRNGTAEFSDVWVRGSLHASVFVADETHATGGTFLIKTAGTVAPQVNSTDNKVSSINSTFTLNVYASWISGGNYFPTGSILRVKTLLNDGAGLDIHDIYLEVMSASAISGRQLDPTAGDTSPGYFAIVCNYRYSTFSAPGGTQIPDGSAVILWTTTGTSGFTGAVKLTADENQAPFIDVFTINKKTASTSWSGSPPTLTPRVRMGNLDGVLGLSEQWGIAAGTDLSSGSSSARYFVASDQQFMLQNIDLSLYNSGTKTVEIGNTGNVKFGTNVTSGLTTTFEHTASSGAVRIGPVGPASPNLYWSGAGLHLRMNESSRISFMASGESYFTGVMTIDTGGEIRQGSGSVGTEGNWTQGITSSTWGSFTGLRIGNNSGVGRLATYSGGTAQVYFDTSGKLLAGTGKFTADATGLQIVQSAGKTELSALRFVSTGGTTLGGLYSYGTGTTPSVMLEVDNGAYAAGLLLTGSWSGAPKSSVSLYGGSVSLDISTLFGFVAITGGYLYVLTGGISAGFSGTTNRGQFVSNFAGAHDYNAIVLQDTTDIAHGMTSLVDTGTYGTLGKFDNTSGGLLVSGYSASVTGASVVGYITTATTTEATGSSGAVQIQAYLKSGTSTTTMGNDDNILAVKNGSSTQFIVKGGNGFAYKAGSIATYDDERDVPLTRAVELARTNRLDAAWAERLQYDRADLERLGIVTFNDDGNHFVNGARMQALAYGAIWELHERLNKLEEQLA